MRTFRSRAVSQHQRGRADATIAKAQERRRVRWARRASKCLSALSARFQVPVSLSRVIIDLPAQFVSEFREQYFSSELIRVGLNGDGGYLVPDVLHRVNACFSPGVGSSTSFEAELWERASIPSFLADATVTRPDALPDGIAFRSAMIGASPDANYVTLSEWVETSVPGSVGNLLLQMDIEGGEYNVLIYEDAAFLRRFAVMVIEFHGLGRLGVPWFHNVLSGVFRKLYRDFVIVHAHPNNCCPAPLLGTVRVPDVLEVTFLRRDLLRECASPNQVALPHPLDWHNVRLGPALQLDEAWWKKVREYPSDAVGFENGSARSAQ